MSEPVNATIKKWVDAALQNENLENYKIEVEGQTNKGDGYAGDINFIIVTGTTKNGETKTINLCIKSSKESEKMRDSFQVKEIFGKEIFIYEKVRPTFEKLLQEKGITKLIDFMPRCYATEITSNREVLIFENLRTQGFGLWDRTQPMTLKHTELVLEAYGRWHALSIALKIQKPEVYQDLTKNNVNVFSRVCGNMRLDKACINAFENGRKSAVKEEETEILKEIGFSADDIRFAFTNMFFSEPENQVILHGDCWNNNFVFKTSGDQTNPSAVCILDWQCSGLASPVFDLSYFIYCCANTGQYNDINTFLKIYYKSFSQQLIAVGCDPQKLFSYDLLLEHWKKYSRFGFFLSFLGIGFCLLKKEDLPDLKESAEKGEDFSQVFMLPPTTDEVYLNRLRNNILHFCNNKN